MDKLEIIGTLVGLVYIWLEYKASIYLWIAGVIMPAIYIVVYFNSALYANMGINVYYLLASVYGICVWLGPRYRAYRVRKAGAEPVGATTGEATAPELPITRMPVRYWWAVSAVMIACMGLITWILIRYTDSEVPYGDSFATALSVVAMWMLARKYVDQWLLWIVIDAFSVGLYIYVGLYPTAILFGVYTVIAIFAWFNWLRMMKENER